MGWWIFVCECTSEGMCVYVGGQPCVKDRGTKSGEKVCVCVCVCVCVGAYGVANWDGEMLEMMCLVVEEYKSMGGRWSTNEDRWGAPSCQKEDQDL